MTPLHLRRASAPAQAPAAIVAILVRASLKRRRRRRKRKRRKRKRRSKANGPTTFVMHSTAWCCWPWATFPRRGPGRRWHRFTALESRASLMILCMQCRNILLGSMLAHLLSIHLSGKSWPLYQLFSWRAHWSSSGIEPILWGLAPSCGDLRLLFTVLLKICGTLISWVAWLASCKESPRPWCSSWRLSTLKKSTRWELTIFSQS